MCRRVRALLVEHDNTDHDTCKKMLQCFFHEVTAVKLASTAVSFLLEGEPRYDLVMANMDSPDACGLQLLNLSMQMNLFLILMSNDDDDIRSMKVLEEGGVFCIKKPVTMEVVRYIREHGVVRRMVNGVQEGKEVGEGEGSEKMRLKTKVWVEWTDELHRKFMGVARFLGEGRCFPRAITDLMDVPGLSRMQVASHLQRCRNAKWLPPGKKRSIDDVAETSGAPKKKPRVRAKTLSIGSMPEANDGIVMNVGPPPTPQLDLDFPDIDSVLQSFSGGLTQEPQKADFDGTLEGLVLDQLNFKNRFVASD